MIGTQFESLLYKFLTGKILIGFLVLVFLGVAFATAVFLYHWNKYGVSQRRILIAETVYLSVGISLFVFACISLVLFLSA